MPTETRWLDVLPSLPLERGVPVVHEPPLGGEVRRGMLMRRGNVSGEDAAVVILDSDEIAAFPWGATRVDLDSAQGFAYALRFYAQHAPANEARDDLVARLANVHLFWQRVSDEHRLTLARALRDATT